MHESSKTINCWEKPSFEQRLWQIFVFNFTLVIYILKYVASFSPFRFLPWYFYNFSHPFVIFLPSRQVVWGGGKQKQTKINLVLKNQLWVKIECNSWCWDIWAEYSKAGVLQDILPNMSNMIRYLKPSII